MSQDPRDRSRPPQAAPQAPPQVPPAPSSAPRKPPPLPPRAHKVPSAGAIRAAAAAPVPSVDGFMSTQNKMSLADVALALRGEQLEAKVVHYKADLATSPELDAITAQVVADLREMQRAAKGPSTPPVPAVDRAQLEIELIQSLKEMLAKLFRPGKLASIIERKLGEVSKRFARLFFESELHERLRGSSTEVKTMRFKDQALYHVLTRNQDLLLRELESFDYTDPSVHENAVDDFERIVNDLRSAFLARTTPELNTLVKYLNEVLTTFFTKELPPMVGELAWEVVKEARLAEVGSTGGYKLSAGAFPRFRLAFERRFLQRLVPFAEDEMLKRAREGEAKFRAETIRFVADPHIFSDVCDLVCDGVYDFLYNDGFLDLPADWRARILAM